MRSMSTPTGQVHYGHSQGSGPSAVQFCPPSPLSRTISHDVSASIEGGCSTPLQSHGAVPRGFAFTGVSEVSGPPSPVFDRCGVFLFWCFLFARLPLGGRDMKCIWVGKECEVVWKFSFTGVSEVSGPPSPIFDR